MKPIDVKKKLSAAIDGVASNSRDYCVNAKSDFKRNRKLPFKQMIQGIIGMGGGSLSNEILDMSKYSLKTASTAAFVQQRSKIKPEAFATVFQSFSSNISQDFTEGMRVLAIDGSAMQIATNPNDVDSFFSGTNGQKPYNLLHLNTLYDLKHHIYIDAVIQKAKYRNEHKSFIDMVDRSDIKNALVIADRGYESYNNMAHIQEKGWKFLIRVKDGNTGIKSCLDLPQQQEYDVEVHLKLTRKQTKEVKPLLKDRNHYRYIAVSSPFDYLPSKSRKRDAILFYELRFRVVRFRIGDDTFETVLTNLDGQIYPPQKLKELYAGRWGIETSFRDLKYTLGMLHFHSKKVMCIQQEIYAHLIMYNFSEMITSHVVIKQTQRKHIYKANFSVAVHMCRLFYHQKITSPILEAIISRNVIPVRPGRHNVRKNSDKSFKGFLYRIV